MYSEWYQFTEDFKSDLFPNSIQLTFPAGIKTQSELFAEFVRKLSYPEEYGHHFDILDEEVDELPLDHLDSLVFVHHDIPVFDDPKVSGIYLSVIYGWKRNRTKNPIMDRLKIFFPKAWAQRVDRRLQEFEESRRV